MAAPEENSEDCQTTHPGLNMNMRIKFHNSPHNSCLRHFTQTTNVNFMVVLDINHQSQ